MDESGFRKAISDLPLGGFRFHERVGSTNDSALAWAAGGAADLSLVVADEQTAGRGRGDRQWFTPPGVALAFSLVNRPSTAEEGSLSLFSGLGAIAVCEALGSLGLHPEIKWPNDVLLNRRKVCGILAEAVWIGEKVDCIVLGIGVNVKPGSVPPPDRLNFPATSVEAVLGDAVDRLILFREYSPGFAVLAQPADQGCVLSCLGKIPGLPWGAGRNPFGRRSPPDRSGRGN